MTILKPTLTVKTVGSITTPVQTFQSSTEASQVVAYFHKNDHETGVVVVDDDKPIGLVMREKLFRKLATKYGVSLFWNRGINQIMDANPLILDESVTIERASVLSMGRRTDELYDLFIVTSSGHLKGSVTIQTVLNTVTTTQMQLAREANPLTGLPGNRSIELELSRRLADTTRFSVLYIDLDHFKWFNDTFGFQKGDQAIQALANSLLFCLGDHTDNNSFIGHIGGDDFMVVTAQRDEMVLAKRIQTQFNTDTRKLFPMVYDRLWTIRNREGTVVDAEGLTMSISILICDPSETPPTKERLAQYAGDLKTQVKSLGGNCVTVGHYSDFLGLEPEGR